MPSTYLRRSISSSCVARWIGSGPDCPIRLGCGEIVDRRSAATDRQPMETSKMLHSGRSHPDRRAFIGGSDARIIMGGDEASLVRLWREKRGEAEPEDLSGNLIVQLGLVTEALN